MRTVAVLFARSDSVYYTLPGCDVFDIERDARTFQGGVPVAKGIQIPGFPGYFVTHMGEILSCRKNSGALADEFRVRQTSLDAKGYAGVTLIANGRRLKKRVHRLVAEAFLPNPDGLPCVRHLDGDKRNNAASNLAWGTYAENEADKIRHGTWGARVGGAKLSADDRIRVASMRASGCPIRSIASEFDVHPDTISRVLRGKTWRVVQ